MSIWSISGHTSWKLVLVAEAMSMENLVSWGRLHTMCNLLTCENTFMDIIYVTQRSAAPSRYVYQHGEYSLVVIILPVWRMQSDSGLCTGHPLSAGRFG